MASNKARKSHKRVDRKYSEINLGNLIYNFPGYIPNEAANRKVEKGAQKKAEATGMYTKDGQTYYIKQSRLVEGVAPDDIAEAAASFLMGLIANVAACHFVQHKNGEFYLASKCFNNFIHFFPKKDRKFLSQLWLSSNPIFSGNKKEIINKLKTALQMQDLADIVAASAFAGDSDCQVGNICFFSDKRGNTRIGRFDLGWAFADLFKDNKNAKINLFDMKSPVGVSGTHPLGGVPTNHYKDYQDIVLSHYFIKSLSKSIQKMEKEGVNLTINKMFDQIVGKEAFRGEGNGKKALCAFAAHMKLVIPEDRTTVKNIRNFMAQKLQWRLQERLNSMALIQALLQIKLRVDENNKPLNALQALDAFRNVIQQRFKGIPVSEFMPAFEPSVSKLLEKALTEARKIKGADADLIEFCAAIQEGAESEILEFCEAVKKGKNPTSKPYTRHLSSAMDLEPEVIVNPKLARETVHLQLEALAAQYKASSENGPGLLNKRYQDALLYKFKQIDPRFCLKNQINLEPTIRTRRSASMESQSGLASASRPVHPPMA